MEPFTLAVPQHQLDDLRERLGRTRWPDQIAAYGWRQGTELSYLRGLVEYWRTQYDWRQHEARINLWPQYLTRVGDQQLHLVHVRSPHPEARPLLLVHGWPGGVYEFYKVIPLLTEPERWGGRPGDAFHVVAPSLPGYGFSPPPSAPGAHPRAMAQQLHELLTGVLGYGRFALQGGDWGSLVTSWLALDHPEHVIGLHLNMIGLRPNLGDDAPPLEADEQEFLAQVEKIRSEEFAYQAIQGTRPQTLGYGLNDSPVGLAAWLVEKYRAWSDCGGDPEQAISRDDMLTLITLYWVTGSITSSMRLYYEFRRQPHSLAPGQRVEVPVGFAAFPREILNPPRAWAERSYRIVRWTVMPKGGHFAALETPELLAADVGQFFRGLS